MWIYDHTKRVASLLGNTCAAMDGWDRAFLRELQASTKMNSSGETALSLRMCTAGERL